jgi:hypothetical protein
MYAKLVAAAVLVGSTGVMGCVSHEAHLKSDTEVCQALGHSQGGHDYDTCMRALNQRRCEDRSNRDPMCQYAGAK